MEDFKAFYKQHAVKIWLLLTVVIMAVLILGCLFLPDIFWDKFIYRYYWGPVEVDASESGSRVQSDGYVIDQGYTLVSEVTYGILLILALYGIYKLLLRLDIKIDSKFVFSVLPYFFLGGTLRVLEDAELFREPYVYLFISPVIYFVIGAVIMAALLFCVFLGGRDTFSLNKRLILGGIIWLIFDAVYILVYFAGGDGFNYMVHPLVPLFFSIIMILFLVVDSRKKRDFDPFLAVFLFGLFLLAFSIFVIMLWPSINIWKEAYLDAHGVLGITTRPYAGILVIIISVGITFCTFVVGNFLKSKRKVFEIYNNPVNLLIIFSQIFDAVATYVGVDLYGYSEKHPIPDFFFQTFGTSAVFIPIKLILACGIVYLIDISFSNELKDYPILKGLIKIVVIVLGLGPGTRDMLRMVMGV